MQDVFRNAILVANDLGVRAMAMNDWYNAGDQIMRLVQGAVDSGDFSQLGSQITNVVSGTVSKTRQDGNPRQQNVPMPDTGNARAMEIAGYGLCVLFVLALAMMGFIALLFPFSLQTPIIILLLFILASLLLGRSGQKRIALGKRFRQYMGIMGDRTYCAVEELANEMGVNIHAVQRDLRQMIKLRFFPQGGYMDEQGTVLITDRATYEQYLSAQESYQKRKVEQEAAAKKQKQDEAAADKNQQSPEYQKMFEEGQNYIRHIRECNDKIPGEEISAKLDRLELVVKKIFQEAEKHPEKIGNLRKMMSYYLPTMQKLLDTYCELEDQPISGQNVENTKHEIEQALDTLNTAFENLLDGLFQEQAWDISSDISVLNTMLAQEGLTGKDFDQTGGMKNE